MLYPNAELLFERDQLKKRVERLERELIKTEAHFKRIYRIRDSTSLVEQEISEALSAILLAREDLHI